MLLKVDPAFLKTAVAGDRGVKDFKKRQKKSRSDFFWRRPLGCVLKETYAEGGKKRLVTCVDKESFFIRKKLYVQKAVCISNGR